MNILNYISDLISIDQKYLILILKTVIFFVILDIIKKIGIKTLKKIKNNKKEYVYTQKLKIMVSICKLIFFLLIWSNYLSNFLTLISLISAGFTIALRDLIFNFFLEFI